MIEYPSPEQRRQQVLDALAAVRDPEIDEPVDSLRFVCGVRVDGAAVEVIIQPPTFWCPANFVFLIAGDMRAAVLRLGWVQGFRIRLLEHFAGNEIAAGINEARPFACIFPGQAGNALEKLRRDFDGKAFLMRQRNLLLAFQKRGLAAGALLAMTLAEAREQVETGEERQLLAAYLEKRQAIGLAAENSRLVSDLSGCPVSDLAMHLRKIKMIANNAAANGEMCRMLVDARQQNAGFMMQKIQTVHIPAHIPVKRHPQPAMSKEATQ